MDSSLWCEPDFVVKVFLTMIAKKDLDDIVRGSAFNIAQWAKKTEAEVLEALKILAAPDTKRIEPQPFDGRRIRRVPDGWLVLNGSKYRQMMSSESRREYRRIWQADRRKKQREGLGKTRAQVRAEAASREARFVEAHGGGDSGECDRIAAEGLPAEGQ